VKSSDDQPLVLIHCFVPWFELDRGTQEKETLTLQKSKVLASFRTNLCSDHKEVVLRVSCMSRARRTFFVEVWIDDEMMVVASLQCHDRDNEDLGERHWLVWRDW
jgi:hypothetical protein